MNILLVSWLINLVIIGITMEVILKITRMKISSISFYVVALISFVATRIVDQVLYEAYAQTSLWTGVWVSSVLIILYRATTKARNKFPLMNSIIGCIAIVSFAACLTAVTRDALRAELFPRLERACSFWEPHEQIPTQGPVSA